MILLLKIFGYLWIALALTMVIADLQPFNLRNYAISLLSFAPAFAAFAVASLLKKRTRGKT